MIPATVNGLDLALIALGLIGLAWIVLTYDPKDKEPEEEGPFNVTISCASYEEQEELFYYLVKEIESGGLPYDATVHMDIPSKYRHHKRTDPDTAQAARVDAYRNEEVTSTGVFEDTTAGSIKGGGTPGEVIG